jgi:hypothetical protein
MTQTWTERTIYDQRRYQTGRNETAWSRVSDWDAYCRAVHESVGRSLDRKRTVKRVVDVRYKDCARFYNAYDTTFCGAPISREPKEPETIHPASRKDRVAKLVEKYWPFVMREHRKAAMLRPLTDIEVLRAVHLHMISKGSIRTAMRLIAKRVPERPTVGDDTDRWITQLGELMSCGLVETDGKRFWPTSDGHLVLGATGSDKLRSSR